MIFFVLRFLEKLVFSRLSGTITIQSREFHFKIEIHPSAGAATMCGYHRSDFYRWLQYTLT